MKDTIAKVTEGKHLTSAEAADAMRILLNGEASQAQIGSFLTALRMKGETVEELFGFASVIREKAQTISPKKEPYLDLVGTGGDKTFTFNVSTTSAIVAAGAGLHIAKHGNRSISSRSGAGDVLEALGVNITAEPEVVEACVDDAGIGFMFAQTFNKSMRFVGQARSEMGIRTVFNILGPLANPSRAKYMMVGVYSPDLVEQIAKVMLQMGIERAFVVSGHDNMDEITTTGKTKIAEIKNGEIEVYDFSPESYGFSIATMEDLKGGDGVENARITRAILEGEDGPKRDIVLMNAAAALYIAGLCESIEQGIVKAKESIDSGQAMKVLDALILLSNA
ncbi:MAG: anthranilate phosphoribosyltransferase [Lachnospiraceae bacterium]